MGSSCAECGFQPLVSVEATIGFVEQSIPKLIELIAEADASPSATAKWSPAQYLWHTVDVLRFGTERILTIALDPSAGAMPWDADEMMQVRSRSPHSVPVGIEALRLATNHWLVAARSVPRDGATDHPDYGEVSLLTSLTRNAHEIAHHTHDIATSS